MSEIKTPDAAEILTMSGEASFIEVFPGVIQSPMTDKLDEALAKAKEELMSTVKHDSRNPGFNSEYTGLGALLRAATKPLAKHGLTVRQHYSQGSLSTKLSHSSGQFEASIFELGEIRGNPKLNPMQVLGSNIKYARRYAYMNILGMVGDTEDDGNDSGPKGDEHVHNPIPPSRPPNKGKQRKPVVEHGRATEVNVPESFTELLRNIQNVTSAEALNAQKQVVNQMVRGGLLDPQQEVPRIVKEIDTKQEEFSELYTI